jgi:hypothetical protein
MRKFRLGAYRLPAGEAGLLRAIVVLLSNESGSRLRWEFVDHAPFDALVADGVSDDFSAQRLANVVAYVTAKGESAQGMNLARPLQAERLEQWLLNIQENFLRNDSPVSDESKANSFALPLETATMRFKLRKWPPAEVLRADPIRIRLATLLGRRALTVPELAYLGGQSEAQCNSFLQALRSLTLLDISTEEVINKSGISQEAISQRSSKEASRSRLSLVQSIRMRLGLN